MKSPSRRISLTRPTARERSNHHRGKHNRDLYNSSRWIKWRAFQLERITREQWNNIQDLSPSVQVQVLDKAPVCAVCLDLARQGAYDIVEPGEILDHILCLNPSGWEDTKGGVFGEAFDPGNVQPTCPHHHGRKSARDARYQEEYGEG